MISSDRLVIVGGVAGGLSAATRARRVNPSLEIVVYEKGPDISYSACGLPHLISGIVKDADALRIYSPDYFLTNRNIRVLSGHEVTEVAPGSRKIMVIAPGGGSLLEVPYGRLILATGAQPARPAVPGNDLGGIFHVTNLQSTLALQRHLEERHSKAVTIIGGGYIALEMADALTARGIQVTMLVRSSGLFESVDEDIAAPIEAELTGHGVRLIKDAPIAAFLGDREGCVRRVTWENGANETDCVVLATGVRPNVHLAEQAGIQLGKTGAIAVSDRMETSDPAIYAAGDCAEAMHVVSERPVYFPLGTTANKQGRVAGDNAAGGRARFAGIAGTAAVKVFALELARTGLNLAQAKEAGFSARAATVRAAEHARYLGGKDITVKVVADQSSGRLLGAQMVGVEGVAKRIDVFAAALQARMTVEQVGQLDLSYAPPFSTVWDPVLIAAQEMTRELRR